MARGAAVRYGETVEVRMSRRTKGGLVQVTVYVDEGTLRRLDKRATRRGQSRSAAAGGALRVSLSDEAE